MPKTRHTPPILPRREENLCHGNNVAPRSIIIAFGTRMDVSQKPIVGQAQPLNELSQKIDGDEPSENKQRQNDNVSRGSIPTWTELSNVTQILVKATLLNAGFHQHKRVWRKARNIHYRQPEGGNLMDTDRLPSESRPFDTLENLVQMAQQGDTTTLPAIRQLLDRVPAIWEESRILAQQVERSWLTTLCGQDLGSQEVINREIQALRCQLLKESTRAHSKHCWWIEFACAG